MSHVYTLTPGLFTSPPFVLPIFPRQGADRIIDRSRIVTPITYSVVTREKSVSYRTTVGDDAIVRGRVLDFV